MSNAIKWVFEMVDKISGPAKSAGASLGDMIQVTHSALAAVQLIGQAAIGAGQMIASGLEPAISREKSLGAFETLLGNAEQARKMYGEAVKFAAETPFETAQVVDAFQRLLTAKFSEEEVPIALRIIGDAASMQEDSQMAVESITRALSQIRSKGRLQGEELMQIQEAVPLDTQGLDQRLAKLYGVSVDIVKKMKEAGQIDSQTASFAILEQLSEQFGGNMVRASTQVSGLVSTLQSRPSEFLAKLQDTKGYDALRDVLGRMAGAFDPETSGLTPFVTQLGSGVLERASVTLDYLSAGAVAFMEGLSAGLGPLGEAFGPTNQDNLTKFKTIMEGVGTGVASVAKGIGWVVDKLKVAWDYLTKIGEWWAENKTLADFLDKFVAPLTTTAPTTGIRGGTQAALVAQASMEQQSVEALPTAYADMTPAEMAEAYDLPALATGAIVRKPTVALIGEAGPEAVVPLSGRSGGRISSAAAGGNVTVNAPISLTFQGSASASDAQSIAAAVGPVVEAHLFSVLERLALQSGRLA